MNEMKVLAMDMELGGYALSVEIMEINKGAGSFEYNITNMARNKEEYNPLNLVKLRSDIRVLLERGNHLNRV